MTTSTTTNQPDLTPEVVAQLRAFNDGDIFAVRITETVRSRAGNVLIGKGEMTWGMRSDCGYSVWTGHTHYAGCKSSSIPARHVEIQEVAA